MRSNRRMLKTTPALAAAGVPMRLWKAMPITIARISGLNVANPGNCLSA